MRALSPTLICAGVVGAAQTTTGLPLIPNLELQRALMPAKSLLVTVPLGSLIGILIAYSVLRIVSPKPLVTNVSRAYAIAVLMGLPVSVMAPIYLAGLGPHPRSTYILSFFIQYTLAWILIAIIGAYENRAG